MSRPPETCRRCGVVLYDSDPRAPVTFGGLVRGYLCHACACVRVVTDDGPPSAAENTIVDILTAAAARGWKYNG